MTTAVRPDSAIIKRNLKPGDSIDIDVEYCDLVPPTEPGEGPAFRFKGHAIGANGRPSEYVKVFIDVESAEFSMKRTGVIRAPIGELPTGETVLPVRLAHRRLTLRRRVGARGWTSYEILPRDGAVASDDEALLADYHWAYAHVRNDLVPLLEADRLPVGAADVVAMTHELFNARRRSRQGR